MDFDTRAVPHIIYGADFSYANGYPDWNTIALSGRIRWAYCRASYGTNPADDDGPVFVHNHDGAKSVHIPFGAYHFFLFGQDPKAQAHHFLQQINGREGQNRPMVDVEEGSGSTGSVQGNIDALAAFNAELRHALGCDPIIYTNADTWDTTMGGTDAFSGHTLWVASFGKAGDPAMPTGFKRWTIQQYSESGSLPGVVGNVDLDVLAGPLSLIAR